MSTGSEDIPHFIRDADSEGDIVSLEIRHNGSQESIVLPSMTPTHPTISSPPPPSPSLPSFASRTIYILCFIFTIIAVALSQPLLTTSLPLLTPKVFPVPQSQIRWAEQVWNVASTAVGPIYGRISYHYGRQQLFIIAILLFIIGEGFSALAENNFYIIIFMRMISGIGGGGIFPLAFISVAEMYEDRKVRSAYASPWSAIYTASAIVAPHFGKLLVTGFLDLWRWLFYIPIILAFVGLILALALPKRLRKKCDKTKVDWVGILMLVLGIASLIIGMAWTSYKGVQPDPLAADIALQKSSASSLLSTSNPTQTSALSSAVMASSSASLANLKKRHHTADCKITQSSSDPSSTTSFNPSFDPSSATSFDPSSATSSDNSSPTSPANSLYIDYSAMTEEATATSPVASFTATQEPVSLTISSISSLIPSASSAKLVASPVATSLEKFPYNRRNSPYPNELVFNLSSLDSKSAYSQLTLCSMPVPAADDIDGIDGGSGVSHSSWLAILIILLAVGSGLLALFVWIENKDIVNPEVIPLKIFKNKTLVLIFFVEILFGIVFSTIQHYLPIYFASLTCATGHISGLDVMPPLIGAAFASFIIVRILARWELYLYFVLAGGFVMLFGVSFLAYSMTQPSVDTHNSDGVALFAIALAVVVIFQILVFWAQYECEVFMTPAPDDNAAVEEKSTYGDENGVPSHVEPKEDKDGLRNIITGLTQAFWQLGIAVGYTMSNAVFNSSLTQAFDELNFEDPYLPQQITNLRSIPSGAATPPIVEAFAWSLAKVYLIICIPACVIGVAVTLGYFIWLRLHPAERIHGGTLRDNN